jgi:phosphoglycolate phosphatase-like HAD superfamily hydrolase
LKESRNITSDDEYSDVIQEYVELFKQYQASCAKDTITVFDGVHELLSQLRDRGCELAIVTSRNGYFQFTFGDYYLLFK